MGFAVARLLAQILDRGCKLAMATSTSHSAATFLEVARLVKEIGTADFRIYVIINKLCVLENMITFSRILMLLQFIGAGKERESASRGGRVSFLHLQ